MTHRTTVRRMLAVIGLAAALAPHVNAQNTPANATHINALRRDPVVIRGGWCSVGPLPQGQLTLTANASR